MELVLNEEKMNNIWHKLKNFEITLENNLINLCQDLPFCDKFSQKELKFFIRDAVLRNYQNNEIIYKAGKPAAAIYFVISGSIGLYRHNQQAPMERIRYVKQGECFGEEALFGANLRSYTANAQEETQLIAITASNFKKLVRNKPKIANKILHFIACNLYMQLDIKEDEMRELTYRLTKANIIV